MLEHLRLFALIVERGGMAAAGRELGLSPATVSARVAWLEEHYGTRLLNRTTRSLSPTSEGVAVLEGARRVLEELEELEGRVRFGAEHLSGSVRLSAPVDLGKRWLIPLLDQFIEAHPEVHIDLHLSDGYVDLAGNGFDLALRYGMLHDSSLRSRRLAQVRRVVCASPEYLARRGTPRHPEELCEHDCLVMRFGEGQDVRWPFVIEGSEVSVTVRGNRTSNDGEVVRHWCMKGYGIARKSQADIHEALSSGALVALLADHEVAAVDLQLVYSAGKAPARRVRALMEHVITASETLVG